MPKPAAKPRPVVTEISAAEQQYETPEARSSFMLAELAPLAAAMIATAVWAAIVDKTANPAIKGLFADGAVVANLMAFIFSWFMFRSLARFLDVFLPERKAIDEEPVPVKQSEFDAGDVGELARRTAELDGGRARLLMGRLNLAVDKLYIRRSAQELAEILRLQAEADAQTLRGERAFGEFLFWAVPVLGLAGALSAAGAGQEATGAGPTQILLLAVALGFGMLPIRMLLAGAERKTLAMLDAYLTRSLLARLKTETAEESLLSGVERMMADMAALQEALAEVQGAASNDNAKMRENLETLAAGVARAAGDEFKATTSELAAKLEQASTALANAFETGAEFTALQQGLASNIEDLGKVHDLGHTMHELKAALAALKPALESLSQPIPLRFTIEDDSPAPAAAQRPAASPAQKPASAPPKPAQAPAGAQPRPASVPADKSEAKPEEDSPKSNFSAAATMPDPRHFGASSLLDDI